MLWLVPGSRCFLVSLGLPHTFGVGVTNAGRLYAVLQDRSVADEQLGLATHSQGTRRQRP